MCLTAFPPSCKVRTGAAIISAPFPFHGPTEEVNVTLIGKCAVAAVLFNALCGCAALHRTRPILPEGDAGAYVDSQMAPTIASIDKSLQTLVVLERGDEAPRKPGAIADTVAGGNPPLSPTEVVPNDGGAAKARAQYNLRQLETRVSIQWSGNAQGLLEKIAAAIGFRALPDEAAPPGTAKPLHVAIKADDISVRELLELVAHQIDGKADIHVDASARTLGLVRRGY